jgi:hypothetical protein
MNSGPLHPIVELAFRHLKKATDGKLSFSARAKPELIAELSAMEARRERTKAVRALLALWSHLERRSGERRAASSLLQIICEAGALPEGSEELVAPELLAVGAEFVRSARAPAPAGAVKAWSLRGAREVRDAETEPARRGGKGERR